MKTFAKIWPQKYSGTVSETQETTPPVRGANHRDSVDLA